MADMFRAVPLAERHFGAWKKLYAGYARFYQTELPDGGARAVWDWICAGQLRGLGGEDGAGTLCGIAHWAPVLRPLHACQLAYLHDLYVSPDMRGRGLGAVLLRAAGAAAKAEGCKTMRWATAADNKTAMFLYDKTAAKTSWVIYERQL